MKIYEGRQNGHDRQVTVNGQPLRFPELGTSFSPCSFDWGHAGHEAGALAFALLADHFAHARRALRLHTVFLERVVSRLPGDGWVLTTREIESYLEIIIDDAEESWAP